MSSELRIIRFKLDEVASALRDFAPRIGLDMPDGELTSAAQVAGQEIPCTSFALKGGGDELSVSNSHLAASLIHYCITGGVPLPRTGNKEISVSSKFVDLKVGMDHRYLDGDAVKSVALNA